MTGLACEHYHPATLVLDNHHIQPVAWGGGDELSNRVRICPNIHRMSHTLLNRYKRNGGTPPWEYRGRFGPQVRLLAKEGWERTVRGLSRTHPPSFSLRDLPDL